MRIYKIFFRIIAMVIMVMILSDCRQSYYIARNTGRNIMQWRAEYLDWYVAHSSLKADILPVANTQLGPGSLAAILGGVFEGGEDTIWIHPDPDFNDEIVFNPEHPNWILHKELLKACKAKANGHYYVGMPDLMEGLERAVV